MWNPKKWCNKTPKQKETHRYTWQIHGYQGERVGEWGKLGVWDQQIHTTIYKLCKQQGPTAQQGNYIQYLVKIYKEKLSEKG